MPVLIPCVYDCNYGVHVSELQAKHELKMQALRDELELRRKTEIHEIEEVNLELEALPVTTHFSFLSANVHTYLSQFCHRIQSAKEWSDQCSDEEPREGVQ